MPRRHTDFIAGAIPLAGRRVLEVGCGEGWLVAWLRAQGAEAVGLDAQASVARVAAGRLGGPGAVLVGRGEGLPLASASFDAVVYLNSLHHLPVGAMAPALDEAARVLAAGGSLLVIEPLAEGPYFELLLPIEDETDVRESAWLALQAAGGSPLWQASEETRYAQLMRTPSAAELGRRFIAADAARAPAVEREADRLALLFDRLGEPDGERGRAFRQPFRAVHLRRGPEPAPEIVEACDVETRRACFAIRRAVFVEEQGVPLAGEFDAEDRTCPHLLATIAGQPAGTLRWRRLDGTRIKVERVAVLRRFRGAGVGAALMRVLLARLDEAGVPQTVLHAQLRARVFYERLGYVVRGEPFEEEGIVHIEMERTRPL